MRVSDIEFGKAYMLEFRIPNQGVSAEPITVLSEAYLFFSDLSDTLVLRIGELAWDVTAFDAHQQNIIDRMIARNLPRVAWVTAVYPRGVIPPASVTIQVREFPSEILWPDAVDLGVDEKTVDAMRRKRKAVVSINDAVAWLTERVIISDQGGSARILYSGNPSPQAESRSGFRLYGRGIAVDVFRNPDDRLVVARVLEAHRPTAISDKRPIVLGRGQFKFIDHTIAGCFRGAARTQLDQLVESADSYLSLWKDFNKLERQGILRRARAFGWHQYSERRPLADNRWQFTLINPKELEDKIRILEEGESVALEAAEKPPVEFRDAEEAESDETSVKPHGRVTVGEYSEFNRIRSAVVLRILSGQGSEDSLPPERGVLFISLSGDRKRLDRREKAQSLIASAECQMPQLGLLIEGKAVPVRRCKKVAPLSAAVREAFGGEPTTRQIEALKVALNTPDIALIQGPPGTGKTRMIAALQARLAEINKDSEGIAGKSLLTSYQHDAVENVASATRVYGLPATKIGQKIGQTQEADVFERWRREAVEEVNIHIDQGLPTPAAMALRRCRDLAVGYLKAPSRFEDVFKLIGDVLDLACPYVPAQLADRLLAMQQSVRPGAVLASRDNQELELALKVVRGLRVNEVSYSDDGPEQALKALLRLDRLGVLSPEERALLDSAAREDGQKPPDFFEDLRVLQQNLLDRLLPDERPVNTPVVNVEVEALLGDVIDALRERVRSTGEGVESVLYEYRDDLELDPHGAREAVEQYTAVLAATCQQAVGYKMLALKSLSNVSQEWPVFETVVVDEAARANPLDLFIPMALAERRLILVGDHRQLPHILEPNLEYDLNKNVQEKTREMLKRSLFERLFIAMREREQTDGIKRTVTLNVQYRMHPVLASFVSDTFYRPHGEAFESIRNEIEFEHDLDHYRNAVAAWVDIPLSRGRETGRQSKRRIPEAQWIAKEVYHILNERPDYSVGVISFYSAQVHELYRQMQPYGLIEQSEEGAFRIAESLRNTRDQKGRLKERLRIGSVDAFQGKEFDVVFLSLTRSNDIIAKGEKSLRKKYGHLMLENRLCVAMSRQQRLLVVVGDAGMLETEVAAEVIPGMVRFRELCGGSHGIQLHA